MDVVFASIYYSNVVFSIHDYIYVCNTSRSLPHTNSPSGGPPTQSQRKNRNPVLQDKIAGLVNQVVVRRKGVAQKFVGTF